MMNNLPFQIPISSLKYYYGTKLVGFAYENSLSIMIRIPLTYAGGIFKLYKINTIKLPLPVKAMKDGVQKYAKLSGYPDYLAISYDEEYYMEMTHTELINCKGLDEYPKVCNPVKIMESVRDKPSCGLAIYKGDAVMMKTYCKREYYEQRQPDNQVYQLDGTSELLITAPQGHFIQHCNNAGQMITIKPCKLCIIKLPCNCILRTSTRMVPPLMNQCERNLPLKTNSTIRYPVNLLVLSQMLNDTELEKYNGSVTFKIEPHIKMWDIQISRIKSDSVVGIHEIKADLDKAMNLSIQQEDMYLTPAEYAHKPTTLMENIVKSNFAGPLHLFVTLMSVVGAVMAMISYKKGCVSSTMAAMALQHTKGAQALPDVPTVHVVASVAPPDEKINEDLLDYWLHVKPMVYIFLTYMTVKLLFWIISKCWRYLTTRLLVTPFDGMPGKGHKSNVYLNLSNGYESLRLYVYTISTSNDLVQLIQM